MTEHEPALDDSVRMVAVLPHLLAASALPELEGRYLDWVSAHIQSFAHGVYIHDTLTGRPRSAQVRGLNQFYVSRYERFGRGNDPVLRGALEERRTFDDSMVMPHAEWVETPIARGLFHQYDMGHVMCTPVVRHGDIVGTINFARRVGEPAFDDTDRQRATLAATLLAAALIATDLIRSLESQRDALRVALDACQQAVIVSDLERAERHANLSARRLLDSLGDDWRGLEPLLDIGTSGRLRLDPADSREPIDITVTSACVPENPSLVLTLLSVDDATSIQIPAGVARLLTAREVEIAGRVAGGEHDHEIARALLISPNTVKHHLKSIYLKLAVHSRVALTSRLLR